MYNDEKLVGLSFEDAQDLVLANNLKFRVVKQDGRAAICTRDYNLDRVNVELENGHVIATKRG